MSISADSSRRGCATKFSQPMTDEEEQEAQTLVETIYDINCRIAIPPLEDIIYRTSDGDSDIIHPAFYWDMTPYSEAFENGFQVIRQENTPDIKYYGLNHIQEHQFRNLDARLPAPHVFIRATINCSWTPKLEPNTMITIYRYEIYAPGGIWVAPSLGQRLKIHSQDEVLFVAGIAPQYIRCAQPFQLVSDERYTRCIRVDNEIRVNGRFNPKSHPSSALLNIQRPIFDCIDTGNNNCRLPVSTSIHPVTASELDTVKWYTMDVGNVQSYIDAAFRSTYKNEAYLFMKNEYVVVDYAPGSKNDRILNDRILNGPKQICDGYPSLKGTAFADHGIDCAFGSHEWNEAFIFAGNLCAKVNYAPHTTNDTIIRGPVSIAAMFPFFKGTIFEDGIDAAFESSRKYEAYLFKGGHYAHINYGNDFHIVAIRRIIDGFFSFRNTIFESGIDAAFASHRKNEAYIFKGKFYALINFAPGTTNDYILGGIKETLLHWPCLHGILPRRNRGLDVSSSY